MTPVLAQHKMWDTHPWGYRSLGRRMGTCHHSLFTGPPIYLKENGPGPAYGTWPLVPSARRGFVYAVRQQRSCRKCWEGDTLLSPQSCVRPASPVLEQLKLATVSTGMASAVLTTCFALPSRRVSQRRRIDPVASKLAFALGARLATNNDASLFSKIKLIKARGLVLSQ